MNRDKKPLSGFQAGKEQSMILRLRQAALLLETQRAATPYELAKINARINARAKKWTGPR